jgi:RIO kinase 1
MDKDKIIKKLDRKVDALKIKDKNSNIRKTYDKVFDHNTLLNLNKIMSMEYLDTLEYPIKTGKEGAVFLGKNKEGKLVAVKIYYTSTSTFKNRIKYIEGDPRFKKFKSNSRSIAKIWAGKEYKNLLRMLNSNIRVPKPIFHYNNVLIMEYIGDEFCAAPWLKNSNINDPENFFKIVLKYMIKMFRNTKLVHGDLNEYNILVFMKKPVIIDVGQSVVREHPMAFEFLEKDVNNIIKYFSSLGVILSYEDMMKKIIGFELYKKYIK